jgi:hypothetical protein
LFSFIKKALKFPPNLPISLVREETHMLERMNYLETIFGKLTWKLSGSQMIGYRNEQFVCLIGRA